MDDSKFADLFEEIYGFRPTKSGHSYELLVAAAIKSLVPALKVKANQYVRGDFSKELYQLDALVESLERVAVESKDYSKLNHKVGRPDLSKLAGALNELPIESGLVVSATDFTRHAKKYAQGTRLNPNAKPIDLLHVRVSTEEDEKNRIRSIEIELMIEYPDFANAKWIPVFSKQANEQLKKIFPIGTQFNEHIDTFYRADGEILITMYDLTKKLSGSAAVDGLASGEWGSGENIFIKIRESLIPIEYLKYEFRFLLFEHKMTIGPDGKAVLLVRSEDGKIDKILTDSDLKKLSLNEDGSIQNGRA